MSIRCDVRATSLQLLFIYICLIDHLSSAHFSVPLPETGQYVKSNFKQRLGKPALSWDRRSLKSNSDEWQSVPATENSTSRWTKWTFRGRSPDVFSSQNPLHRSYLFYLTYSHVEKSVFIGIYRVLWKTKHCTWESSLQSHLLAAVVSPNCFCMTLSLSHGCAGLLADVSLHCFVSSLRFVVFVYVQPS